MSLSEFNSLLQLSFAVNTSLVVFDDLQRSLHQRVSSVEARYQRLLRSSPESSDGDQRVLEALRKQMEHLLSHAQTFEQGLGGWVKWCTWVSVPAALFAAGALSYAALFPSTRVDVAFATGIIASTWVGPTAWVLYWFLVRNKAREIDREEAGFSELYNAFVDKEGLEQRGKTEVDNLSKAILSPSTRDEPPPK